MSIETSEDELNRLRLERNQFHAALRRQRAAIIEQCARAADLIEGEAESSLGIAAAIRALKDEVG